MLKLNFRSKCLGALCLVFATVAGAGGLRAQEISVNFPSRNITIESAFALIESQTGYLISYKNTNFDTQSKVQLTGREITLTDALDQLLARTNRSYVLSSKYILITPRNERAIPVYIDEPTSDQIEEIITEPDHFFVQETAPSVSELSPDQVPFDYPELDKKVYYAQGHVSRGVNGRADYVAGMPRYALKLNLLYGGLALAPNLGAEFGLTPRTTLDFGAGLNRWNLKGTDTDNKKLTHWILSAEYRYWFCDRFNGHFLGVNGLFGYYNIAEHNMPLLFGKNSDRYRFKGNGFAFGVSYGYQLMIGNRWNLEVNAGVGAGRLHYDKYECPRCGDVQEKAKNRTYFGPTRAGITLMYIIK